MITQRRVYDPGKAGEHYKVLVDRFWPRGISKEKEYNNVAARREVLIQPDD